MKALETAMVFLMWGGLVIYAEAVCRPEEPCPSKCSCTFLPSSDNMLINCSNRGFDQLPILPSNTEMFVIRNSNLTSLPDNAFEGCRSLLYLDLSSNLLKRVGEKAFAGLEQLESLLLNNNSVDITTLSASLLQKLTHLSRLFIHDNDVSDQVIAYNDHLFAPLVGLHMLIMDGLPDATFGPGFSGLCHLEYFRVVGNLQYITNDTFKNFQNSALKTFVVRSGVLTDVDEMAFGYFRHLETLDLSFNHMLGFQNVSKAWYGMQFTNISSIYLKRSVPYDNQIITINNKFLKHLEHTKLKKLVLDANNIVTIDAGFCIYTRHLVHLSVAHNTLVQIFGFMIDVFLLPNLEIFDVSFQSRRSLTSNDDDITSEIIIGSHLPHDVGNNACQENQVESPMTLSHPKHTRELNLQGTKSAPIWKDGEVHRSNAYAFTNNTSQYLVQRVGKTMPLPLGPMYLLIPPMLRIFNAAGSLTIESNTLHEITLFGGSHLEVLNYSMNGVREFWGPFQIKVPSPGKVTMDMSWNDCSFLHPDLMKQSGHYLDTLCLGRNNLGQQLAGDHNGTVFQYFTELVKLDISLNNLKSLPTNVFINLTKMKHLNLKGNALRLINFNITHMNVLNFVDLSANLLDQLDSSTRSKLDVLANKNNMSVDLTDNPLVCSCETLAFLEWVPQSRVRLNNWEKYVCMYNGQLTELSQLKTVVLPKLNFECKSKTWLIASAAVLVALFLLLAILYIMHRYRFEIQYCCLRFVIQRRKYEALIGDEKEYEYDAFVAFDKRDVSWVEDELIPTLDSRDGHGNFKLMLHHRDFEIGTRILENICNGIEKSRQIVLVVSRHFVDSKWCEEELEMARVHCFEEGKELPLVVLLEENLPLLKSSPTLRALLRRNTYLKWPENENERDNFWINLKKKLTPKRGRQNEVIIV